MGMWLLAHVNKNSTCPSIHLSRRDYATEVEQALRALWAGKNSQHAGGRLNP